MKQKKSGYLAYDISTKELDYNLPENKIAKYPLNIRDQSKLLVWEKGAISDSKFSNLPNFLPEKSLLVFNNTKVIRARLYFKKLTGAAIEIFCLDPLDPSDYQISFQQTESCVWNCMVGNLKKWKDESLIRELFIEREKVNFKAEKVSQQNGAIQVKFSWDNPNIDFSRLIETAGILPIPPYLNRETEASDLERYQTVYSKIKGSVAAPTAGLHFTDEVFQKLKAKNISCEELTLHVGAGTFRPVKAEVIGDHEMHAEQVIISRSTIENILRHDRKIIAVGTTSIRTLESLYWLGISLQQNPLLINKKLEIEQWKPYESNPNLTKTEALTAILTAMDNAKISLIDFYTKIIIVPGYQFKITDGIITNFHQPQSTLLLLIAAYLGDDWKLVYKHALNNDYRFLSYGDSNLYLNF